MDDPNGCYFSGAAAISRLEALDVLLKNNSREEAHIRNELLSARHTLNFEVMLYQTLSRKAAIESQKAQVRGDIVWTEGLEGAVFWDAANALADLSFYYVSAAERTSEEIYENAGNFDLIRSLAILSRNQ